MRRRDTTGEGKTHNGRGIPPTGGGGGEKKKSPNTFFLPWSRIFRMVEKTKQHSRFLRHNHPLVRGAPPIRNGACQGSRTVKKESVLS